MNPFLMIDEIQAHAKREGERERERERFPCRTS